MNQELDVAVCEQARLSRDARFDGKFFTAVLTTGIFCRPVCPARPPKPENVQYYLSAEQAQLAGFAPCKRCFPERAANKSLPVDLRSALGRFDASLQSLDDLANMLNIGPRQLQRKFLQHFGVSPKAYFQQQRLLQARKLITTTSLPFTDVCYASGFNSVRRFNEAVKSSYGSTPKDLRKGKALADTPSIKISLSYRPPLDWPLMLSFFQTRQISGLEKVTDTSYQRSVHIDNCTGWLKVTHDENKSALNLEVYLSDYRHLNQVILRVRRMFDLDADMAIIHENLSKHPILAKAINNNPGLRLPGSWDTFEFSIRAILGQQVSVKAATTLARRIVEKYGAQDTSLPEEMSYSFPSPEKLHQQSFEGLGLTGSRISTLQNWVDFWVNHPDYFNTNRTLIELQNDLCQIKGIGPWTVNYLAMRGLSDPDAFPAEDLGVIKALSNEEKRLTPKVIEAMSLPWQPWRAYATMHLWYSKTK